MKNHKKIRIERQSEERKRKKEAATGSVCKLI